MLIIKGITYTKEEKVVDTSFIKISKKEPKTITWPYYVGALAIIGGTVLVLAGRRKAGP